MINIHLSVILYVLDGFTGRPTAWGTLRCTVDGRPFCPLVKDGGSYLFLDLPEGRHVITLSGAYYRPEKVRVEKGCREVIVTMKPAENYPFRRQRPRLTLHLGVPGGMVWAAEIDPLTELKIAQATAAAGAEEVQLFCRDPARKLALPRDFLLVDEKAPELCRIEELSSGGPAPLAKPLESDHKRGCCLYPAQRYQANAEGTVRAVFREPARAAFWCPGGKLTLAEMKMGENEIQLND